MVYLTDQVPNMGEGKNVPTRELDEFERTGLEKLGDGQDIHLENHGKEIRMLGPIFAGASCVVCHGNRGQMLGAFTYEIERVPVVKAPLVKDVPCQTSKWGHHVGDACISNPHRDAFLFRLNLKKSHSGNINSCGCIFDQPDVETCLA